MRSSALLCLAMVAACGDGGLALTIRAPDAPPQVDRIEIVLASPDVVTAEGQLTGGAVLYYRQKSTTGELSPIPKLDGYVVRIEPSGGGGESYVPFAIAYAGDAPVAVGFVSDGSSEEPRPLAIAVPGGTRVEATVDMVALLPADPALGVMSGQIEEVRCNGKRSGLAWQPPALTQLRIVFPDPAKDGKLDASERPLDLDCDGFRADGSDCDDLRARIAPGAAEKCDGEDTNCDGAHYALVQCDPPDTECLDSTAGIQACHDADNAQLSECHGTPACRCRPGSTQCSKCTLAIEGMTSPVKVCAPAAAKLSLPTCLKTSPCVVEVMQYPDSARWSIEVASAVPLDFQPYTLVVNGELVLRVKARDATFAAAPGESVGAVHLAIVTMVNNFQVLSLDLQLGPGRLDGCSSISTQEGVFPMVCTLQ